MSENTYKVLITTVGREKLAAALATGTTVKLKSIALGDGNGKPAEPTETQTALAREVYRADMLSCTPLSSAPENIVCVLAIPASAGGWTVREIGIFDTDGALFAVGNIAEAYKPAPSEGTSREMLLRCIIGIGATDAVELVTDPAQVIATQEYVQDAINDMIHGIGELGDELREWAELIGKYKYKVLTREEYDAIVLAGTIEENVIYFVKGTKGIGEVVDELSQRVNANEEGITKLKSDVAGIETRLDTLAELPETLAADFAALSLKHENDMEAQAVSLENLEQEVDKNREDLSKLAENINQAGTSTDEKLSGIEERLTTKLDALANEKAQEVLLQEMQMREQSDATLTESIRQLSETVSENSESAADHENRVTRLEEKTDSFETEQEAWRQSISASLATETAKLNAEITRSSEKDAEHEAALVILKAESNSHARANTGVLKNPVLLNAYSAITEKVLCPEISDNANMHGWLGVFADLGVDGSEIVPAEITLYRRNNSAQTNTTAPRYLRVLRRSPDGTTWTVAYESTNALAPNSFSENEAMTWTLANKDGRGSIPTNEQIIVTQTDNTALAATANVMFGAKVTAVIPGAMNSATIPTDATATISTQNFSPAMDILYYATISLSDTIGYLLQLNENLTARVAALESGAQ